MASPLKDTNFLKKYETFQEKIGYTYKKIDYLVHALTHSSYTFEHKMARTKSNERLEYLGDAVLELVSSDFLFHHYPQKPEGELSKLRASLVCEVSLAQVAKELGIGELLLLGKGEDLTGGRERPSLTSDAVEAVIGSIYLDGGLESAKTFILGYILNDIENKHLFYDSKTILQEMVQAGDSKPLRYELVREDGPDHNKEFEANALLGEQVVGTGIGKTKKAAEQLAAYHAILALKQQG